MYVSTGGGQGEGKGNGRLPDWQFHADALVRLLVEAAHVEHLVHFGHEKGMQLDDDRHRVGHSARVRLQN